MRLLAESVGSVQNSVPNLPNVCRIGANRGGRRRPIAREGRSRDRMLWQKARACVHLFGMAQNCGKMGV